MVRRHLAALLLAASALWGCGVATAPVSVTKAVASNANYDFRGPLVDQAGNPLDGVLMAKEWHHLFWTPVAGGTKTDEHSLTRVDRNYSVSERGTDIHMKFTKDGFYDAEYTIRAADNDTVITPEGAWPNADPFPVVLYSKSKKDDVLHIVKRTIDYTNYPTAQVLNVEADALTTLDAENAARRPAGTLYLTITREPPPTIDSKGTVDPADVNLPGKITLHITGKDNGFARIQPRIGYHPIRSSEVAPTLGYSSELTIDRKRLQEMRRASDKRLIENREYFFFRANGHYGKGFIRWSEPAMKDAKTPGRLAFSYSLWLQPNDNDPNIITRAPLP